MRRLKRTGFVGWCNQVPEGTVVRMEATGAAHHWGRMLEARGVKVALLPPQHVKALRMGNKTDANDTDAIHEAGMRPKVRPVAVKSREEQAMLAQHRLREGRIKDRTRLANQMRGLLAEFGLVLPKGLARLRKELPGMLEDAENGLPDTMRELLAACLDDLKHLDARIAKFDRAIEQAAEQSPDCKRILAIEGVGPLTATAAIGALSDLRITRARQFSASLGLVPREHSSGNQRRLGKITKRGNGYLRKMLIHGARSALNAARGKDDPRSKKLNALRERIGPNKAAVALANKNARIMWALVHKQESYCPQAG